MSLNPFDFVLSIVHRSLEMSVILYRILVDVLLALEISVSILLRVSLMYVDCDLERNSLYSPENVYLCGWPVHASIHLVQNDHPILMYAMFPFGFLQWPV